MNFELRNILVRLKKKLSTISPHLVLLIILMFPCLDLRAQTEVSGEVSGIWNLEGSPYIVTGDLLIPVDSILFIEPGVTIEFPSQDENRFVFNVHGTLEALGTEEDSIYFLSSDSTFRGFSAEDDFEGMRLQLEYCVVDSTDSLINVEYSSSVVLRHSRLHFNRKGMLTRESADTVQNCEFIYTGENEHGRIASRYGGPHVFTENTGEINWDVGWAEISPVFGNRISEINLWEVPGAEIFDNEIDIVLDIYYGDFNIHDNIGGGCGLHYCDAHIENNLLRGLSVNECGFVEILKNYIFWDEGGDYTINVNSGTECVISYNLITTPGGGISSFNNNNDVTIINNTIVFGDRSGVQVDENTVIRNNIFLGTPGYESIGIWINSDVNISTTTHYNLFYEIPEIIRNNYDELNETNLVANPQLCGGNPFDYHLQANSPCIDAGDPESPDDPDGTRADIGCYFYDQSIDNPPTIIAPQPPIQQTGQPFYYEVTATDDNGPLEITFPDLPFWMQEDELDWVGDTTSVSGLVPEDQEAFSFQVVVEDGLGQSDSAEVFVGTDTRTVLDGIVTGTLTADMSPYYVVTDIIVPNGDSLIIEPGCELQFRYVEVVNQRLRLTCYGTLMAEGTEEDSIWFTMVEEEAVIGGWGGIRIVNSPDTSYFSYINNQYAQHGILTDSFSVSMINNSLFNNYLLAGIAGKRHSSVYCNQLFFNFSDEDMGSSCIYANDTTFIHVKNSTFINSMPHPEVRPLGMNNSYVVVEDSYFERTKSINVDLYSTCEIRNNVFYRTEYVSVGTVNWSSTKIENNIFYGEISGLGNGISTYSSIDTIANNIFVNLNYGIRFRHVQEITENHPQVINNVFTNCFTPIVIIDRDSTEVDVQYNVFYDNDSSNVNCFLDSTNLFVDPLFADTLYHLYANSLLIDAGNPDPVYDDIDGSRNDIGLWGGPWGEVYDYPVTVEDEIISLPTEFTLIGIYPNPFNSMQKIYFYLPTNSEISLKVYNLLGQTVKTLSKTLTTGFHTLSHSGKDLASGIYFIELHAGKEVIRKRVVFLK